MLMMLMCDRCGLEALEKTPPEDRPADGIPIRTTAVPVQTAGLYRGECPQGHVLVTYVDMQAFELLFESGMEAMADRYFREAVSSFAAALERYFEFAIKVLLADSGRDNETVAATWKAVASQSERQLGMYIGLYSGRFGKVPSILPNKMSEFRNGVIHKGHFPGSAETFKFGAAVYTIIMDGIAELRVAASSAVSTVRQAAYLEARKDKREGENPGMLGFSTTVSLMNTSAPEEFHVALNKVAARLARQRAQAAELSSSER